MRKSTKIFVYNVRKVFICNALKHSYLEKNSMRTLDYVETSEILYIESSNVLDVHK